MKLLISFSCCVLLSSVVVAPPQEANTEARARILVRQLGNAQFKLREVAAAELTSMGRIAKAALEEGLNSEDAEISVRCSQLLPKALAYDLRSRIDRFVADKEGILSHDLPFWKEFNNLLGSSIPAREVYLELLQNHTEFLFKVQANNSKQVICDYARKLHIQAYGDPLVVAGLPDTSSTSVKPDKVFAVLFVATAVKLNIDLERLYFIGLSDLDSFVESMKSAKVGLIYQKVLYSFLTNNLDDFALRNLSKLLVTNGYSEGANLLAKALIANKKLRSDTAAEVIYALACLGNKSHISALYKYTKDSRIVNEYRVVALSQVRDFALASIIHLSGKDPASYGFANWSTPKKLQFTFPTSLGLQDEKSRSEAFKKWAFDSK
ncbi:MAG: hypothetical protein R3B84_18080 [Zavarzinella sp.]